MNQKQTIRRYLNNIQAEVNNVTIYRAMSKAESNPNISQVFEKLAVVEEKHMRFWQDALQKIGAPIPEAKANWQGKLYTWMAKQFGPQTVLPMMAASEAEGQTVYDDQPESKSTSLPGDERSHVRLLQTMLTTVPKTIDGGTLGKLEGRHRAIGGNALRAAVLGANDGLLSNLSLIMGVAGANLSSQSVVITGIAGLLAGAFSMGIGEWISVQSSRELNERELQVEADELEVMPEEEKEELVLIYQAKGIPEAQARELAEHMMADKSKALDTLAREELGIDPHELGGSAWEAAYTSFALFALGAIIPVAPFFFTEGFKAETISMILSSAGIFCIGGGIALVTGRSVLKSGFRQLLMALIAANVTYFIGKLLGVTIAG